VIEFGDQGVARGLRHQERLGRSGTLLAVQDHPLGTLGRPDALGEVDEAFVGGEFAGVEAQHAAHAEVVVAPDLEDRLENFLKETSALQRSKAKFSAVAQGQTEDSIIIVAHFSSPDQESVRIRRETFVSFQGKKDGKGFVYLVDLSIPVDRKVGPLVEIKPGQPLTLRFEIKKEQVEGMLPVNLLFVNRALVFPRRCWSGRQSVQVRLVDE